LFGKLETSDIPLIKAYMAKHSNEAIYLKYPVEQFEKGQLQGVLYGYMKEQSLIGLFYFSNKRSLILHFSDQQVLGNLNLLKAFKNHSPKYVKGEYKTMQLFYKIICRTVDHVHEDKSLLMTFNGRVEDLNAKTEFPTIVSNAAENGGVIQDLKFFMRVENAFGRNVKSVQDIQKTLDELLEQNQFCLVHNGSNLIAQGIIEEECEDMAIIGGIYVDPQFRNRKLGKFISQSLTKRCLDKGKAVYLFVLSNNRNAIALYENIGFTALKTFSIFTIEY